MSAGELEFTKSYDFSLKADDLDKEGQFVGHCAVFGNVDLQGDKIERNAFSNTIRETKGRWPILMAHRMESVIGFSTGAEEDSKGLVVRGELTLESTGGRDAYALMKHASSVHQNLGLSIGYRIRPDGYEISDRTGIRTLKDLDVMEFSVAVCPANPRARVLGVKSAAWTERDFEEYLRDAGLSREAAKRFVLRGYGGLHDQRDADDGVKAIADEAFSASLRELKDYLSLIGV
jgi:uncharacterized protein